jgi:hypothetical protein
MDWWHGAGGGGEWGLSPTLDVLDSTQTITYHLELQGEQCLVTRHVGVAGAW